MHIGSIHQPDFIPWDGFFNKVLQCDTLIILDHVTVPKKSWVNRNFVRGVNHPILLTVPVNKGRDTKIRDIQISEEFRSGTKILRSLEHSYSRSPHFDDIFPLMTPLLSAATASLATYNLNLLKCIFKILELEVDVVHSTDLSGANPELAEMNGNELLLTMAQMCDFDGYVSGRGCLDFIRPNEWEERDISFRFQDPRLAKAQNQSLDNEARPNLSILDALMEIGPAQTRERISRHSVFPDAAVKNTAEPKRFGHHE